VEGYDSSNREEAMNMLMKKDGLVTGLIYQNKEQPSYQELVAGYSEDPLNNQGLKLDEETFDELVKEFM
jgi:2-oxoglutarate/2-oxoacid ferredoxin oxidoreductase subunit beta